MDNAVNPTQMMQFSRSFRQIFQGHDGKCTSDAIILDLPGQKQSNPAEAVAWAHEQITALKGYTQMLFIVCGAKNSPHYIRIKKSADIRFGILSQVVVGNHVRTNNAQYHSNITMKINAKLGGSTSRTLPP